MSWGKLSWAAVCLNLTCLLSVMLFVGFGWRAAEWIALAVQIGSLAAQILAAYLEEVRR